jgi:hypothetical protein
MFVPLNNLFWTDKVWGWAARKTGAHIYCDDVQCTHLLWWCAVHTFTVTMCSAHIYCDDVQCTHLLWRCAVHTFTVTMCSAHIYCDDMQCTHLLWRYAVHTFTVTICSAHIYCDDMQCTHLLWRCAVHTFTVTMCSAHIYCDDMQCTHLLWRYAAGFNIWSKFLTLFNYSTWAYSAYTRIKGRSLIISNQSVVRLAIKVTNYASTGCYVSVSIALLTFTETLYTGFSVFKYCVKSSALMECLITLTEFFSLH